jgi:hypothetical protein
MPKTITPKEGFDIAVVCESQGTCPGCGWGLSSPPGEPRLELIRIERRDTKFTVEGRVPKAYCSACGQALDEIQSVVPIELEGLVCACGGRSFQFAIKSLEPNKAQKPTEWKFELDVICDKCNKAKFVEKVFSFLRLKRIKVGPTGMDVQLK